MPIGIGAGTAIAGIVAGGATVTAATMQSRAAHHAGDLNARAAEEALAFQKEQDAKDRAQYDEEKTRAYGIDDARRAALAPYAAAGDPRKLSALLSNGGDGSQFRVPTSPRPSTPPAPASPGIGSVAATALGGGPSAPAVSSAAAPRPPVAPGLTVPASIASTTPSVASAALTRQAAPGPPPSPFTPTTYSYAPPRTIADLIRARQSRAA